MISAVVIAKNEEKNIGNCVEALSKVTDDIIVLDSGSTDRTVEIAESFGAHVVHVKWQGYGPTKNLAIEHVKYPWILSIDADEVLSQELIEEIKLLGLTPKNIYAINILTNYCGKWIYHSGWYPSYKKRLYHSGFVKWDEREVHENLSWSDREIKVVRLKNKLLHYSYPTAADHFRKTDAYAKLGAEHLVKSGKNVSLVKKVFGPGFRFFRMYILKRGFLDGKAGFLLALRESAMVRKRYDYYKRLKNEESIKKM